MLVHESKWAISDVRSDSLFAEAKPSPVVRVHISVNADEMLI